MSAPFPGEISLDGPPVTAVDLALYAAASGDHNPLHLDPDVAKAAGFERPVVHGMLSMAYVGRMLTRHFGAGSILALRTKFTGVALRGDRILLQAVLQQADAGVARYGIRAVTSAGGEVVTGEARIASPPQR